MTPEGRQQAVVVVDSPGHILERIAESWAKYSNAVEFQLIRSQETHPYLTTSKAAQVGLVHWLDTPALVATAGRVRAAQVATVHHCTDEELQPTLRALRHCDAITTASERWKSRLEGLTGRGVFLVPYAIDTSIYRILENRTELRSRAGILEKEFVIGFVGKASADAFGRKGVDLLLRVLEAAARIIPNLRLVLVGPGWEQLAGRIQALGIKVLRYTFEKSSETSAVYPLMDVLLVTSSEEGGPCTILEAMACGVPVVTSDVGHVPEVIRDGLDGFICPSRSVDEYVARMRLLQEKPELRQQVATEARQRVERERDEKVVVPRVDFAAIYLEARRRFAERSLLSKWGRGLSIPLWASRYGLSRLARSLGLR